jgi:hypothetical protein
MLRKVTIYGERCSGTNYLEELLTTNFNVEIVWKYGWKHFFGFSDLSETDDVLFIGIVRNITDWVNSLYRDRYHLPNELVATIPNFLNNSFYSIYDDKTENMHDRNIETNNRYKNIFELRHVKNKFLVDTMPTLVKNYLLITYDDLVSNFVEVMNKIKNSGLEKKNLIEFPLNIKYYKRDKNSVFVKKNNKIGSKRIIKKANLHYEKILFPNYDFETMIQQ